MSKKRKFKDYRKQNWQQKAIAWHWRFVLPDCLYQKLVREIVGHTKGTTTQRNGKITKPEECQLETWNARNIQGNKNEL